MIDREKLIKLLYIAPCESELEGKPGSCPYRKRGQCGEVERLDYCAVQLLADHLIANGVTVRKWIPVTERLPEVGRSVIAYNAPAKCAAEAVYKGDGKFLQFRWAARLQEQEVTHWMPLPEPPKGE